MQQTQDNEVLSSLLCVCQGQLFRKLSAVGHPENLQPKSNPINYILWKRNCPLNVSVLSVQSYKNKTHIN